jgi:hypothetical protein
MRKSEGKLRSSFLKKRSKRLFSVGVRATYPSAYLKEQKFFGSFFQKRTPYTLFLFNKLARPS